MLKDQVLMIGLAILDSLGAVIDKIADPALSTEEINDLSTTGVKIADIHMSLQ
jgi:hypothetical protein